MHTLTLKDLKKELGPDLGGIDSRFGKANEEAKLTRKRATRQDRISSGQLRIQRASSREHIFERFMRASCSVK